MSELPVVLSVAGSDPSGGAGIQADLKTFAALGVFGTTALTLATVGNTRGVTRVIPLGAEDVAAQIDAVCEDLPVCAAKTGMLGGEATIHAVADALRRHRIAPLVVDPVMTTRRGDRLLDPGAEAALIEMLLPLATVVTPNLPEAERLAGTRIRDRDEMIRAAEAIRALGAEVVVIKGGHGEHSPHSDDLLWDGERAHWLTSERIDTVHTHGAGCTLSAAIAAGLARGWSTERAVQAAKHFVTGAIRRAPGLGHGRGPLHHGWEAGSAARTLSPEGNDA